VFYQLRCNRAAPEPNRTLTGVGCLRLNQISIRVRQRIHSFLGMRGFMPACRGQSVDAAKLSERAIDDLFEWMDGLQTCLVHICLEEINFEQYRCYL
jgi:hypothetical protein